MNTKLYILFFFLCLVLIAKAVETETKEEGGNEVGTTTPMDNTVNDNVKTTDTSNTMDTSTTTNTDENDNKNNPNEDKTTTTTTTLDTPIENASNTNTTLDACGHTSRQFGVFSFAKPISKSVVPIFSNFTINWYYNNILESGTYFYPTNNITIGLYFEQDANSDDWSNAWKSPVWEQTIPMNEISEGPTLTGNVKSYQWDWKVMYNNNGLDTQNYKKSIKTNEKYKLRISGDGKDIQRNPELKCYQDGDIAPGSTRPFYIVDNTELPIFNPMDIPDSAFSMVSFKPILQYILPLFFIILLYFF
ncbi:hypothetical protein BCR36DRAFT_416885 [Piromyces finnis]|uniref:Concanavalin A-like lectin/glucanase n=1 Tax=Piromyces finnis TaxID=1754191 RepID=A0A1Y1UR47_9FUNG|nr:hypothetical protein BCR36DRAFT_416885 [Piromyces finnis]|eukprot:ORX40422.1 hypothetical protein BCR36DRAFT_416885 [Piromyces finnis]